MSSMIGFTATAIGWTVARKRGAMEFEQDKETLQWYKSCVLEFATQTDFAQKNPQFARYLREHVSKRNDFILAEDVMIMLGRRPLAVHGMIMERSLVHRIPASGTISTLSSTRRHLSVLRHNHGAGHC